MRSRIVTDLVICGDTAPSRWGGKINEGTYVVLEVISAPHPRVRLLGLHDDQEIAVDVPPDPDLFGAAEPPYIATIIFDPNTPGDVLVDDVVPLAAPVFAKTRRGDPAQFELPAGKHIDADQLGLSRELVDYLRDSQKSRHPPFMLRLDRDKPEPVWLSRGGEQGWKEGRQQEREAKRREWCRGTWRKRLQAERDPDKRNNLFINPYTFVPLPPAVRRSAPAGHRELGEGRLSGAFRVRWTLRSPLLLPQDDQTEGPVVVPGSSIKGSVRSIHEVLVDGCLRVLDPGWKAVHRQASPEEQGRSAVPRALAVVHEVDPRGAPTRMMRCEAPIRLPLAEAAERIGPDPSDWHSGMEFDWEGGRWVLHVSALKPGSAEGQTHIVMARLNDIVVDVAPESGDRFRDLCAGSADFNGTTRDRSADEDRSLPRASCELSANSVWANVRMRHPPAGVRCLLRRRTTGRLQPGDSLWVNEGNGRVEHFSPAQLWREHGDGSVGERLTAGSVGTCTTKNDPRAPEQRGVASPCDDVTRLCPTCQIFGAAADMRAQASREAQVRAPSNESAQRSYAAHVRFGPAISMVPLDRVVYELPPQGSPNPSCGAFYLEPRWSVNCLADASGRLDLEKALMDATQAYRERLDSSGSQLHGPGSSSDRPPLSYWGSDEDKGNSRRRIAGRCFYWHGFVLKSNENPYPRHRRRPGQQNAALAQDRRVVEPPAVLESEVWFEGLTPEQLGGLLAAVQPGLVLDDVDSGQRDPDTGNPVLEGRQFSTHLGGGKGLGLGSVRPEVVPDSLRLDDARSRYSAGARPVGTPESLAAQFAAFVLTDGSGPPLTWQSLASVLTEDRVSATLLWYPPGCGWDERFDQHRRPCKHFDESFRYFQRHRGGGLGRNTDLGMQALPAAVDPVQSLSIDTSTPGEST